MTSCPSWTLQSATTAKDGPASDPLLGQVGHGVVGPGRAKLAAARGPSSVVVGLVPGRDRPQVSFADDQHRVGDLGPGGEHEPLRQGIRTGLRGGIFTASMRRRPGPRRRMR